MRLHPIVSNIIYTDSNHHYWEEDEILRAKENRMMISRVGARELPIGTLGVGPAIAIVAMGNTASGRRVNGIYHWTGPNVNEDVDAAARNALETLSLQMLAFHVMPNEMRFILVGGEECSRREQQALLNCRNIFSIYSRVLNMPYENDYGWDIVVDNDTIYCGPLIIDDSNLD